MPKPPPRFEDAIGQLEQIIDRIESGEVGLESAIAEYEKGMKLIGQCRAILDGAERRIAELTETAEGELAVSDGGEHDGDGDDLDAETE